MELSFPPGSCLNLYNSTQPRGCRYNRKCPELNFNQFCCFSHFFKLIINMLTSSCFLAFAPLRALWKAYLQREASPPTFTLVLLCQTGPICTLTVRVLPRVWSGRNALYPYPSTYLRERERLHYILHKEPKVDDGMM